MQPQGTMVYNSGSQSKNNRRKVLIIVIVVLLSLFFVMVLVSSFGKPGGLAEQFVTDIEKGKSDAAYKLLADPKTTSDKFKTNFAEPIRGQYNLKDCAYTIESDKLSIVVCQPAKSGEKLVLHIKIDTKDNKKKITDYVIK